MSSTTLMSVPIASAMSSPKSQTTLASESGEGGVIRTMPDGMDQPAELLSSPARVTSAPRITTRPWVRMSAAS